MFAKLKTWIKLYMMKKSTSDKFVKDCKIAFKYFPTAEIYVSCKNGFTYIQEKNYKRICTFMHVAQYWWTKNFPFLNFFAPALTSILWHLILQNNNSKDLFCYSLHWFKDASYDYWNYCAINNYIVLLMLMR